VDIVTTAVAPRSLRHGPALFVGFVLTHAVWLVPLPLAWRGTAAELLLMLPGVLLALLLFRAQRDPLQLAFLGLCGGIAFEVILLLALHALPGGLPWWLVILPCDLPSLLFGWLLLRQPSHAEEPTATFQPRVHLLVAGMLMLGVAFRFLFLGRSEFQGDEANALLMALEATNGRDDILLWHSKGPAEVLLPAGPLALLGNINEWTARLPFALVGVGTLLGVYLLARQMFHSVSGSSHTGNVVGLAAATILAVDGYMIAFSRIVQYQSIVVLMMVGALWCCWRFYEGASSSQPYLICAAVLASVGLLAHYDSLFVLPALAWLVIAAGRRREWQVGDWLRGLVGPVAIGAALAASFYVPFVLHQHFGHTLQYLVWRTGHTQGISTFFNNLTAYYQWATLYNTTFQINALAVVLAIGILVWLWMYGRPRPFGWALMLVLFMGCAIMVRAPGRFVLPTGTNWAIIAFALPLAGLALSPATPLSLRILVLWFAPPFLAESFLFGHPSTHFYTIDAAAALLVGLAIAQLAQWLRARGLVRLQIPLLGYGVVLLLLAIPYMYIVFVRQMPEYRLVFPAARPAIYRASYQDKLPKDASYFGFPHLAGWKVVGELYRQGILRGSFESNEDYLITHWYTHKAPVCAEDPDYYFLAQRPLDRNRVPMEKITSEYRLFGSVLVDGVKKIEIYSRAPSVQPAREFEFNDYGAAFESHLIGGAATPATLLELTPENLVASRWRGGLSLQSYDLGLERLFSGQDTTFVFRWQAAAPLDKVYEVFVDIVDDQGRAIGSIEPPCQATPTTQWHAHKTNNVLFSWVADPTIEPGAYTLQVGLRDTQNGARMLLADGTEALTVATLKVVAR